MINTNSFTADIFFNVSSLAGEFSFLKKTEIYINNF